VQAGDIVKSIDGQPVGAHTELDALREMVVGEVGTFVSMALERPEDDDSYSAYEVSLMRGNEEYFAQLKVPPPLPSPPFSSPLLLHLEHAHVSSHESWLFNSFLGSKKTRGGGESLTLYLTCGGWHESAKAHVENADCLTGVSLRVVCSHRLRTRCKRRLRASAEDSVCRRRSSRLSARLLGWLRARGGGTKRRWIGSMDFSALLKSSSRLCKRRCTRRWWSAVPWKPVSLLARPRPTRCEIANHWHLCRLRGLFVHCLELARIRGPRWAYD
jgi:hypothetical protein